MYTLCSVLLKILYKIKINIFIMIVQYLLGRFYHDYIQIPVMVAAATNTTYNQWEFQSALHSPMYNSDFEPKHLKYW